MRIVLALIACVCSAGGMAFGEKPLPVSPDEIFYNGKIVTVDRDFHIEQAFAVKGERILRVGSNSAMRALAGPRTRLTDLRGHAVIPGLIDSHNHQYMAAMLGRGVDMGGITSLTDMFGRLRQAVAKAKPGEVILGTANWEVTALVEKRAPTRDELDRISTEHPILLYRGRGAAFLNSAALKAAGVTRDTKTIAGIPIPVDADGEPSGQFNTPPSVMRTIAGRFVPPPSFEESDAGLLKTIEQQHAVGLTGIRDLDLRPEAMRAYWHLWREKKLTMRVSMGLDVLSTDWDKLDDILKTWGVGPEFGDHWLRIDSVSEFAVDSVDGLMREPYLNPAGEFGRTRITPEQMRQAALTMNRYGWRPAPHTIGDRTLDYLLDAYAAADAESSIRDKRWIVEHVPFVQADQMDRMAKLGVLISANIQGYNRIEGAVRNVGRERAEHQAPMRELLDHHVIVGTGSDWPGDGPDSMFVNMGFYVTRKTKDGKISGAAQKISREEALRVATYNNAYITFEEDEKGSIEAGKLADFLILDKDILAVPEDEIASILPLATYVGGQKVFSRKGGGS
jgi:predicted amidohydrolase YtcJ